MATYVLAGPPKLGIHRKTLTPGVEDVVQFQPQRGVVDVLIHPDSPLGPVYVCDSTAAAPRPASIAGENCRVLFPGGVLDNFIIPAVGAGVANEVRLISPVAAIYSVEAS